MENIKQVFISYSNSDKKTADYLRSILEDNSIPVSLDYDNINPGDDLFNTIVETIKASEYIIIILSNDSINSQWMNIELNNALYKNIVPIPIRIDDCKIPAYLKNYNILDFSINNQESIENFKSLIRQLNISSNIDFSMLDYKTFEDLVYDLLNELKFYDIVKTPNTIKNINEKLNYPDFIAKYKSKDPFGNIDENKYVIELKLYKNNRPDLKSIHQLSNYIIYSDEPVNGLIITNSKLTSVTNEWLANHKNKTDINIKIIDGAMLQRQLIKFPFLIEKYFSTRGRHE